MTSCFFHGRYLYRTVNRSPTGQPKKTKWNLPIVMIYWLSNRLDFRQAAKLFSSRPESNLFARFCFKHIRDQLWHSFQWLSAKHKTSENLALNKRPIVASNRSPVLKLKGNICYNCNYHQTQNTSKTNSLQSFHCWIIRVLKLKWQTVQLPGLY